MLYLIWGLLNLGLVIYFLVICFRATKLVKEKIGLFAAVFFVLGLLSVLGQPAKDSYNKKSISWDYASVDSLNRDATYFVQIILEDNWISKKDLVVKYGTDKQGLTNIPISAYSTKTGFTSGTIWRPNTIKVYTTDDNNKFRYYVVGLVEWKLLGATIYTQSKRFNGIVSTK
jgi:hypothetical protein